MRSYIVVSGLIFVLVTFFHVLRLIFGWPVRIGDAAIPIWISWIGLILAGSMATWAAKNSSRH